LKQTDGRTNNDEIGAPRRQWRMCCYSNEKMKKLPNELRKKKKKKKVW
jgi:hypothetical protein